ncbi:ORC-CDC6 family AAA ATPase [Deinococcus wulumuqiensis]
MFTDTNSEVKIMPSAINLALMRLTRRSENVDTNILVETFVDTGTLGAILGSADHQIIYGRRGTGKTHALNYLQSQVNKNGALSLFIDLRTIGSNSSIYSNESIGLTERVSRLLSDVGNEIYFKLQDILLNNDLLNEDIKFDRAQRFLSELEEGISQLKVEGDTEKAIELENSKNTSSGNSLSLTVSDKPSITNSMNDAHTEQNRSLTKEVSKGKSRLHVQFVMISRPIDGILNLLQKRLFLMLDEWSSLPDDVQPYLADMIRRSILPSQKVTVKIAAIEQRSSFIIRSDNNSYTGFELGSDITADIDLDDYMVFDNDSKRASEFFQDLFFRHIKSDEENHADIKSSSDLIRKGFTQQNAFDELVRAAEGVPRDAINIAIKAAQAANNALISIPIVQNAARKWYLQDKENVVSANETAEKLLRHIIDEVINQRKARAFIMPQSESRSNKLINYLYDSRVLHVLKRGISAQDIPGQRFIAFKVDYGCYVELLNTSNSPRLLYTVDEQEEVQATDVPKDDYRSIRRAILDINKYQEAGK